MDLIKMLDQMVEPECVVNDPSIRDGIRPDVEESLAFAAHECEQEAQSFTAEMEGDMKTISEFVQEHAVDQQTMNPIIDIPPEAMPAAEGLIVPPEEAYRHKGMRYKLVFEGVCTHCAHCGQPLTDSASVERGLGPVCSKKGYLDETPVADDAEALLALAEYPTLVEYLTAKYKPQGNRGLVNGLVRTASLNRRTPVHAACCDAVEALGYKRLASALRESISVIELSDDKENPDSYSMWVKRSDFNWGFWNELKVMPGVRLMRYPTRHTIVPKVHRMAMAALFLKYYEGLCVKTPKGAHKITPAWFAKSQPKQTPAEEA